MRDTYSTYWTDSLQEAPGRTVDTRDLLAETATARLPPASSPTRLSLAGTGSTKLRPNSYKTTKGEGIRRHKVPTKKIHKGKYSRKVKQLTAGGRLSPQYSGTSWGTMVTPFRTFLRRSSTSSSVSSRAGTIRDGSSALEYSKPRCSLSFRG
jgi:hypothetical protein